MQKKAKLIFNGVEKIILISDELENKFRIINELALMSMEADPLFQSVVGTDFQQKDCKAIDSVTHQKEIEFYNEFGREVLTQLNITLKKDECLFCGESYRISEDDKKSGIYIHILIETVAKLPDDPSIIFMTFEDEDLEE